MSLSIHDDIKKLKGVGEKTAPILSKLSIDTIDNLIHYYPRDYIQYESVTASEDFSSGILTAFKATLLTRPLVKRNRRLQVTSAKFSSSGMLVTASWFHMPYLSNSLMVGRNYILRGILTAEGDHYHIEQAQLFTLEQYDLLEGKIAPLYPLTKGLTNNALTKYMKTAFLSVNDNAYEEGLFDIHFPDNFAALKKARDRLVFDEFLIFILRIRLLKVDNELAFNNFELINSKACEELIESLSFKLTSAQERVWEEIRSDMQKDKSMSRLVQGDVGSGKTIIAVLAAVFAASNGYQAAVMAPTEILAAQHFESFSQLIEKNGLDIQIALLTGSVTAANKRKLKEKIKNGEIKIIIGTHAIIQEDVEYANLAIAITDEQHRFGVNQRKILAEKSDKNAPHVLVMSATPIPRTLSIILYGDLSVSIIDTLPASKKPIKNAVVDEKYRKKAYEFMLKEIREGRQVYIICPLVEESEGLDAKDVTSYIDEISPYFPEEITIGRLHGKMKAKEKQKVMDDFAAGRLNILVSTTVVEVGVNVPNATVMMIENADRFGLAQLHQLRGRVGRGQYQSFCIFMSSNGSKKTMERLEVLKNSNDGFEIAEEDLKQRGPGDMFGIRQSGDMHFKLADIFNDSMILKEASIMADRILEKDPDLSSEENAALRERVNNSDAFLSLGNTL